MTSPETHLRNLGCSVEELEAIKKSRARTALLNTITSPDFARKVLEAQFVALIARADDPLRATYLERLDGLIETRTAELAAFRAAYRNVAGRSHGSDPFKA